MQAKSHIREMLLSQREKHISFHTPGHKRAGEDITELSYSDTLSSPTGVLLWAERDVAEILGADRSFLLTDGCTSGVYSMLYALALAGGKSVAIPAYCHLSVQRGCMLAGLRPVVMHAGKRMGIPAQPTVEEMERALSGSDALLLVSPDYYGFFPDLKAARALCDKAGKPLLIDSAHGAHLHFTPLYAGKFADLWADGVHKSLPAMTQGAVVSAKGKYTEYLKESVPFFRTTSPSYPILASIEEAVKYPRNESIEALANELKSACGGIENEDWSKLLLPVGSDGETYRAALEAQGIFPEFFDGNYLMFYFSPANTEEELLLLKKAVNAFPRAVISEGAAASGTRSDRVEEIPLSEAAGRTCAFACGLFPPCLPLISEGETVTQEAVEKLKSAKSVFGIEDGKIKVYAK